VAGFALAFVVLIAAGLLFMSTHMGGGSMMGPGGMDAGPAATAAVAALAILGLVLLFLAWRAWSAAGRAASTLVQAPPPPPVPPGYAPELAGRSTQRPSAAPPGGLPASEAEALTLRLLDADERLLFIEVKEKGGAALQKDLGHRDGFSRTKVTRVLDRLESKGLVVREREGMTNRVRLLTRGDRST